MPSQWSPPVKGQLFVLGNTVDRYSTWGVQGQKGSLDEAVQAHFEQAVPGEVLPKLEQMERGGRRI